MKFNINFIRGNIGGKIGLILLAVGHYINSDQVISAHTASYRRI